MIIKENGIKIVSIDEFGLIYKGKNADKFNHNECFVLVHTFTTSGNKSHLYSVMNYPSCENIAGGIRELETALFIANSFNQANNPPSINWQPIEELTTNNKNILLYKQAYDHSQLVDVFTTAEILPTAKVVYSGCLEKYSISDIKRRYTHFAELTPPALNEV